MAQQGRHFKQKPGKTRKSQKDDFWAEETPRTPKPRRQQQVEEINRKPAKHKEEKEHKDHGKANRIVKELISWIIYLVLLLAVAFVVVTYVGQRTQVIGESMEHTLTDGDNIIVDKISYRFRDPQRFDVIVFPYLHEEDTHYIKRIIGLPGESVRIDTEGVIYINGEELQESYGSEVIKDPGLAAQEIQLGDDEYFVMGDNRNHSADSRDPQIGNIKRDYITGRAWLRIWPLKKIGFIRHQ